MKIEELHDWKMTTHEARQLQERLAVCVCRRNEVGSVRLVAGVDISGSDRSGVARAAVVVLGFPDLELVETRVIERTVEFPYVPGLLSFREAPLILEACRALARDPDLVMVDGQGLAHPRRIGLASHLGLFLDRPTIGCAKSRLCGTHGAVAPEPGAYAELEDNGEVIGAAVRTRSNASPVYVSVGHKVDLESAIAWTLACCRGARLPEPTRLAHLAAGGRLRPTRSEGVQMGQGRQA